MKIVSGWKDDLIFCPSQCYLNIEFKNKFFVIYLRWRYQDPWTCCLIETRDNKFNLYDSEFNGIDMPMQIDYFEDKQIIEMKENAIKIVKSYLNRFVR